MKQRIYVDKSVSRDGNIHVEERYAGWPSVNLEGVRLVLIKINISATMMDCLAANSAPDVVSGLQTLQNPNICLNIIRV